MKRLAGYTILVLATITMVILLWQVRSVVGLFFLSLALASAARPPVRHLMQRGLPLWLALLLTYLLGLALVVGLAILLGSSLMSELYDLAENLALAYENTWLAWMRGSTSQQALAARLPPPSQLFETITGPQGGLLAQRILGLAAGVSSFLAGIIAALVLSTYWTVDQARFERLWLSLLPASQRQPARLIWQAIESGVGAYIRSEIGQSFVGIVLLFAGYTVIGLPYPALLALLGGIAWLVPLVGVVLTVAPVLVIGLIEGVGLAIVAVLYTITILLVLELIVEPRLFNRRRYSSILTVLLMLVLIEDFGIVGLIMAPPLSAALQILFTNLLAAQKTPTLTGAADQLTMLRERLTTVETALQSKEDAPPGISNIAARLNKLLHRADLVIRNDS